MKRFLMIYCSFAKVIIRGQMIHRSAFWAGVVAQWLSYGVTFATLFILVKSFNSLAGWSETDILFLYGVYLFSYALAASLFFNPCTHLASKIHTGEFDIALTKPLSPFIHELCLGFNFGYLSHITLSIAVMIGACISAGLSFDVLGFLFFLYMLLGAVLVQAAFLIFSSAFSFFLINQNPIFDIINAFKNFVNYPLHIYPAILQFMLTFVVPVAFINFYPAAAILGKNPGTAFPIEPAAIVPVIGMMLFTLSVMFWNRALKKYQSTGS